MINNKYWIKRVCVVWFSLIFSRVSTVYTWVVRSARFLYKVFSSVNRYWKSSSKRRKVRLNLSFTSVALVSSKVNNLRYRLNVMVSMSFSSLRRFIIFLVLKNIAIIIG